MIDRIYDFLIRVDNDFPTPLSQIVDLKEYATKLVDKAVIFANIQANQITGIVALYCNDTANRFAYIPIVAVAREYRGMKISKVLMNTAISYAKEHGFTAIGLQTENEIAENLYKSLGFKEVGTDTPKYLEYRIVSNI